jgi:anti-anti-sigma factor
MFDHDRYRQFAIVRDVEPLSVVLHVFGDVDLSTVGEFSEAIDQIAVDGGDPLLINLSKCRYFDSSGLAALIHARKVLGARLTLLVDPKSQIYRVMQIVEFEKLFNVVTELQPTRRDDFVLPSGYDHSSIGPPRAQPTNTLQFAPQS